MLIRASLVAAAVVCAATTAYAQAPRPPADERDGAHDREAGQAAFRVGAQAYRANRFAVAARSFEEAYARDPRPETAFSIAQANRLQYYLDRVSWRVQRAVQLYQLYLERLPAGPRARDAIDHLGELEPLLVTLRTRGELAPYVPPVQTQLVVGAEVERATVTVDGRPAMLWEPLDVAAGPHEVVVDAAGYERARRRVVVPAGRLLPIDVALRAKPARITVRSEPGARLYIDGRRVGALPGAVGIVEPGEHFLSLTRRGRTPWERTITVERDQQLALDAPLAATAQRRVARWILGSAAVVAGASGGSLLWAYQARRDADALDRKRRARTATPADLATYNRRVDDVQQREAVALGLGIAAGALTLLGAGMWWFDDEPPGSASRLEVKPTLGNDGATVTLRGTF